MEIFDIILKPFIWSFDNILLDLNLKIAGVPVWTLILAFNITGFTIYGVLQNMGAINLPSKKSEKQEVDHIIYGEDGSRTVFYRGKQ